MSYFDGYGFTINFSRNPLRPPRSLGWRQPVRRTAAATPVVFDFPVQDDVLELTLRLTSAEKADLLTFFRMIVFGMAYSFTYVDPVDAAYTVRFAEPSLPAIREAGFNAFVTTVRLRIE